MPNIPTTSETLQALDVLRRFVEGIDQTFGGLGAKTLAATPVIESTAIKDGEPVSWAARVLAILAAHGGYMSPKEILTEYRRRGWKEIAETDTRIHSTLGQLKARGKVDHDTEGRTYKLKS